MSTFFFSYWLIYKKKINQPISPTAATYVLIFSETEVGKPMLSS
jgi:hypothetical protein